MNAQSGVCTPAGGLLTGEHPHPHTVPPLCHELGQRRGDHGVVGSGTRLCPPVQGQAPRQIPHSPGGSRWVE